MDTLHAIVLALVQGLTEFLPISSSGHLILFREVFGWEETAHDTAFDVAVHVGSLVAVLVYFRVAVAKIAVAWVGSMRSRENLCNDAWLGWAVVLGTIPAGLCGFLFKDAIESDLRGAVVVGVASIVFGLLLWAGDALGKRHRDVEKLAWRDVIVVGLAQCLALIPGTSRSGATMTGGLFTGLTRDAAARYSFVLSIPLILAAGALKSRDAIQAAAPIDWSAIGIGVVVSAVSAYLCIDFFMRLIERIGMLPFVVYRLVLGAFLIWMFWGKGAAPPLSAPG